MYSLNRSEITFAHKIHIPLFLYAERPPSWEIGISDDHDIRKSGVALTLMKYSHLSGCGVVSTDSRSRAHRLGNYVDVDHPNEEGVVFYRGTRFNHPQYNGLELLKTAAAQYEELFKRFFKGSYTYEVETVIGEKKIVYKRLREEWHTFRDRYLTGGEERALAGMPIDMAGQDIALEDVPPAPAGDFAEMQIMGINTEVTRDEYQAPEYVDEGRYLYFEASEENAITRKILKEEGPSLKRFKLQAGYEVPGFWQRQEERAIEIAERIAFMERNTAQPPGPGIFPEPREEKREMDIAGLVETFKRGYSEKSAIQAKASRLKTNKMTVGTYKKAITAALFKDADLTDQQRITLQNQEEIRERARIEAWNRTRRLGR